MLSPAVDNPVSCKIRAIARFFNAKIMSAAEIHRDLCTV
jgi:hypothetical protein